MEVLSEVHRYPPGAGKEHNGGGEKYGESAVGDRVASVRPKLSARDERIRS